MKLANKITTILCDDIRSEVGNKFSLMGLYSRVIFVPNFPILLPKLCLYISLDSIKRKIKKCRVTLKTPFSEPSSLEIGKIEGGDKIGGDIRIFSVLSPFRAVEPGLYKFEIKFDQMTRPSAIHKFEIQKSKKV